MEIPNNMDDDEIFIDFNYFISFCQEVSNIPVTLWQNPQKIIEKVAKQTRMVYRTQQRRKEDKVKAKKRLEYRKKMREKKSKKNNELKEIEAEEKRLRILRLREKAKNVSVPDKNEEKMRLKEWIKKREKKNSKKCQHEMRKWMQQNDVFQKYLYNEFIAQEITSMDILKNLSTKRLDIVLRKVRSDRFAEVKNQSSRNKVDKALLSFEKKWRKIAVNIKPSGSKKKGKKKKAKSKKKNNNTGDESVMD